MVLSPNPVGTQKMKECLSRRQKNPSSGGKEGKGMGWRLGDWMETETAVKEGGGSVKGDICQCASGWLKFWCMLFVVLGKG